MYSRIGFGLHKIGPWSKGIPTTGIRKKEIDAFKHLATLSNNKVISGISNKRIGAVENVVRILSSIGDRNGSSGVPSGAEVVVCGGGVVGTSVVYHLAERGIKDVVLLEQGR